jgi:hypothetical protein
MRTAAAIHAQKNELLRLSLEVHNVTLARVNVGAATVVTVMFGGVAGKSGEACGCSNLAVRCVSHAAHCTLLLTIDTHILNLNPTPPPPPPPLPFPSSPSSTP